jgi:predicted dehydrogenase
MKPKHLDSRRGFFKTSGALSIGYWVAGRAAADDSPTAPSEKLNFACVGVGGMGFGDSGEAAREGNVVAICDVNENCLDEAAKRFPDAKKFYDFRELFDEMSAQIDAVTVSTPDHMHAVVTARALREGKAVHCQKPMTHSIGEARRIADIAREAKVVTQMGNQGTAGSGLRRSAAIVQSGALGRVSEVHVWTDRPGHYWNQGLPRPAASPVPKNMHWNLWLGPAPRRDFADCYYPKIWRGWWDFGTGALGDMGCHTMNLPFMALDLRDPISITAETSGHDKDSYPKWSIITYQFAATDKRPAVKMTWYDGGKRPPLELFEGAEIKDSGSLIVGEKGKLFAPDDYAATRILLGGVKEPGDLAIRESPGHFREFVAAIKGGDPTVSNFPDYAGPLTEMVLLGNLAVWTADSGSGPQIQWDAKNLTAKNVKNLDSLINPEYRHGYSI